LIDPSPKKEKTKKRKLELPQTNYKFLCEDVVASPFGPIYISEKERTMVS
jgi:hypothetical protein